MFKIRLQTKFLLSFLLISAGLTCVTLALLKQTVEKQVQGEIFDDLRNSVLTFQNVQRQREANLSRWAGLLANLPTLKALMTTHDAATVQDGSADLWRLAGASLFILADRAGKVLALHTATPGLSNAMAQDSLRTSLASGEPGHWWFGAGHLYEVFIQPVYFGEPADNSLLGVLAVGYEIDDQTARDVSRIAASQVAFRYGNSVAVSTLSPRQEAELNTRNAARSGGIGPADVQLEGERFLSASVELSSAADPVPVRLTVLKSYDHATAFLQRLNRLLLALGFVAVTIGSVLVLLISHTFTRPLKELVAGVRSLEKGNFDYPLEKRGDDEVAEVTGAFDRMRQNLRKTQQQLLEAERLATIGTMASSISHDLRHSLTAMVANAEFLCGMDIDRAQREDLYQDIRVAADQMTELVESLLEFSRTREPLSLSYANLEAIVRRAAIAVRANPRWQSVAINIVSTSEAPVGWFDEKKLQRVFHNLLLNAYEALPPANGRVEIRIAREAQEFEIWVRDNGAGIPDVIRDTLFQPFVSSGKQNGTGLGLAVVQKIVQDHGGDVAVVSTSGGGTVIKIRLPANRAAPTGRLEPSPVNFVRNARVS
jgi:signal transduction histidine kinase